MGFGVGVQSGVRVRHLSDPQKNTATEKQSYQNTRSGHRNTLKAVNISNTIYKK